MRDDIKELIRNRRHCVLATATGNQPYCSLMAYAADQDCTRIYMATHRNTRKFSNLTENPMVSLLIDSRDSEAAQALTIEGECAQIQSDTEEEQIRELLLNAHPYLNDFVSQPDTAYICIHAKSLVFLNGLTGAYRETVA
ncbi:MAG TPA: pyridoxamine 5'-phosphate oxidase family protein [Desulfosalsimonadaceae bacterium]|nr:pyridoxamine 5'-phosphate oxidase family protein [Desulfosalsimonadaceae bacterium]